VAVDERAKLGPAPASPLFRISDAEAGAIRQSYIDDFANSSYSKATIEAVILTWIDSVAKWQDLDPKGDYQPDDAADVLAKYWIFCWIYGAGGNPDTMTEAAGAGVRAQAHRLFAADPTLSALTEGQRQAFADALIRLQLNTMLDLEDALKAQKLDPEMDQIEKNFRNEFGLELADLGLTPARGFLVKAGAAAP
jgi:hypothetical protein